MPASLLLYDHLEENIPGFRRRFKMNPCALCRESATLTLTSSDQQLDSWQKGRKPFQPQS